MLHLNQVFSNCDSKFKSFFSDTLTIGSSTAVEHSPHHPEAVGSRPANAAGGEIPDPGPCCGRC